MRLLLSITVFNHAENIAAIAFSTSFLTDRKSRNTSAHRIGREVAETLHIHCLTVHMFQIANENRYIRPAFFGTPDGSACRPEGEPRFRLSCPTYLPECHVGCRTCVHAFALDRTSDRIAQIDLPRSLIRLLASRSSVASLNRNMFLIARTTKWRSGDILPSDVIKFCVRSFSGDVSAVSAESPFTDFKNVSRPL